MIFIDDSEHFASGMRLHDGVISVGNCLFFPDEWVEMNRHEATEEVWKATQTVESSGEGILPSTDDEACQLLCFVAKGYLMLGTGQVTD